MRPDQLHDGDALQCGQPAVEMAHAECAGPYSGGLRHEARDGQRRTVTAR